MLRPSIRTSLLTSLALVAFACSGGSSSGNGIVGPPVPIAQIASEAQRQLCGPLASCCQKMAFPNDPAGCAAWTQALQAEVQSSASKAGVAFNEQAMGNCLAQMAAALTSCSEAKSDAAPDCKKIYGGTIQAGGACSGSSSACADPPDGYATCYSQTAGGEGRCIQIVPPKEGMACGYYRKEAPATTNTFGDCDDETKYPDLFCDQTTSTCKKRIAVGDSCVVSTEGDAGTSTTTLQCVAGAQCDYKSKTCIAAPGEGAACTGTCTTGFYCDTTGPSTGWTCKKKLAAGAACNASQSQACESYCDSSTNTCATTTSSSGSTIVSKKICAYDG